MYKKQTPATPKSKEKRWDKKLAAHYGIPKHVRQYAKQYGSSVEGMLSEWLQRGLIKYKPMPEEAKQ
jgi:hypothetical protein